jgi:hypothetical protein
MLQIGILYCSGLGFLVVCKRSNHALKTQNQNDRYDSEECNNANDDSDDRPRAQTSGCAGAFAAIEREEDGHTSVRVFGRRLLRNKFRTCLI